MNIMAGSAVSQREHVCFYILTVNNALGDETCATCEYWLEKYQKCENPEQPQSEAVDYMSPPNKTCDLWESNR